MTFSVFQFQSFFCSGGICQGGICPVFFVLGGNCPEGKCPGGICPGVSVRVVHVWGGGGGGLCPRAHHYEFTFLKVT